MEFINGVTLLETLKNNSDFVTFMLFFVFMSVLGIGLILLGNRLWSDLLLIVGAVIAFVGVIHFFCCIPYLCEEKYEYVVLVDENTDMKEFYKNYEIVDITGEYYTIKIKE